MRLTVSIRGILDFLVNKFYWIIMTLYIVEVAFLRFSATTIGGVILILIGLLTVIVNGGRLQKSNIYFYFLILVGSSFLYLNNELPVSLLSTGIVYCALPMFMYIAPKNNIEEITNQSFAAIIFSLIVSYILFLWGPPFFGEYLVKHGYIMRASQVSYSLQGLYGITAVGTYSACSTLFFYGKWLNTGKNKYLVLFLFSVFVLLTTMRRSAVAACLLMFLVENYVFCFLLKQNQKKQLIIFFIVVFLFLGFLIIDSEYFSDVFYKITNISAAISERSGNWQSNYELIKEHLIMGTGVGSGGHMASSYGYVAVHDNSYLLILRENGILGLFTFLLVVVSNIIKFIRNRNKTAQNYIAFLIVCVFIIQAIGSNVWEFPFSAALFWLMLSICGQEYIFINSKNMESDGGEFK